MLIFSCGKFGESRGSDTFEDEFKAWSFYKRKRFEGYSVKLLSNKIYNTHIVFYNKS